MTIELDFYGGKIRYYGKKTIKLWLTMEILWYCEKNYGTMPKNYCTIVKYS